MNKTFFNDDSIVFFNLKSRLTRSEILKLFRSKMMFHYNHDEDCYEIYQVVLAKNRFSFHFNERDWRHFLTRRFLEFDIFIYSFSFSEQKLLSFTIIGLITICLSLQNQIIVQVTKSQTERNGFDFYRTENTSVYPSSPIEIYTNHRNEFLQMKNPKKKLIPLANRLFD